MRNPQPPSSPARGSSRGGPRIGLLELVLLGAPEGKTELLEGKVYRRVRAASNGEAREIFMNVARELSEFHDTAGGKRLIERGNTVSAAGAHLRVEGNEVELAIEVSPDLWRRFES